MPNLNPFPHVAKRQDDCTPCGQYCCASNEVCYKDTYYYISMCSATATATVISASTETATISATFTVTTEPTYSNTLSAFPITTSTSPSPTSRPSSTLATARSSSALSDAATSSPTTSTSPSPTPQPSSSGLSTTAKADIGGSVAGVSAIILFILLIFCIRRWKKKGQNSRPDRPLSAPPQADSEMEELASGAGYAEARERRLSPEELQRRREQAAEEREPAAYEHSGPNPWALSGSDVAAGRRMSGRWRDVEEAEDDEEDYSELPAGAPYSADEVGNRGHVRHPGGQAPRGAYGAVRPVPPPSHYYGR